MLITDLPGDIWFEILQHIPPEQLTSLQHVSRCVKGLVTRPALRYIFWKQRKQAYFDILHWKSGKSDMVILPREATISVPFNLSRRYLGCTGMDSDQRAILKDIYLQLPLFISLHTLNLSGTMFSSPMYDSLFALTALRTLSISDCTYIADYNSHRRDLSLLPIKNLKLENICSQSHYGLEEDYDHPIHLIEGLSLESLEIVWSPEMAWDYERFIQRFYINGIVPVYNYLVQVNGNTTMLPALPPAPVPAPNLQVLVVRVPVFTRCLLGPLAHLTTPRRRLHGLHRAPRLSLEVQFWSLEGKEVTELGRSWQQVHFGEQRDQVKGLWRYTGPSEIMAIFMPLGLDHVDTDLMCAGICKTDDDEDGDNDGDGYVLRHLCLTPPTLDPSSLGLLLWNVATDYNPISTGRVSKRDRGLHSVEICLAQWDLEAPFAVRAIFPNIQSLTFRVGKDEWDENFLVMLGSDILPNLPCLHTLRVIHDPLAVSRPGKDARSGYLRRDEADISLRGGIIRRRQTNTPPASLVAQNEEKISKREREAVTVGDYLRGWTRYCKALRMVQLSEGAVWSRMWEDANWERVCSI